jgi:hypothetical protein
MIVQNRPVRLKSGAEVMLPSRVFDLPEAELIRAAVTEAAVVQAIGRARGVNRSAANPVEVFMILHDTMVPVAVDTVVEFKELEPTNIDIMIERGLVPAFGGDAAKLYPDLWPTGQAARKAYSRAGLDVERVMNSVTSPYKGNDGPEPGPRASTVTPPYRDIIIRRCHGTPAVIRYKPKARGGGAKSRIALVDPAMLAGAREQIEAALGPLALFEVVTGEDHGCD